MSAPAPVPVRPRSPQKERSGCVLALYVLFGIGLLAVVGGAGALYFFLKSEQGQELVIAAQRGMEWASVASQAPGAEELTAAGCEVAMINSAAAAIDIMLPLLPGDLEKEDLLSELEAEAGADLSETTLVLCILPRLSPKSPACEEFARTYGDALEFPPDDFALFVLKQGEDAPQCSGLYTPTGERKRAFER